MSEKPEPAFTAGEETFLECFRVQPGVPFSRAFDEISVLQGCILHLTTEAEFEGDLLAGSAARMLSAMAKALINDLEIGLNRNR
ncbi:DUF3077 domain-containing protein [Pseudomonas entomophila]|uniref:DUF3077 domain-containing protein n=2 Tax=Pseudomonas entomophila TaxID=312306 RepID=Q1IER0_PSEE4|nr:DUF3077 domain-containing protein [Pseudomonas entomophila]WMW05323.1 DUF3077 domain-containing protein [Pseudomonas entomophila]CAK13845.1 conserved hypothetical protein [Pseudomonas entomophila L48]